MAALEDVLKRKSYKVLLACGVDARILARALPGLLRFLEDARRYRQLDPPQSFRFSLSNLMPIVSDFRADAGTARGHYFHQDLWAARKIFERRPTRHMDIGSRIDGFVAHLLVFMPVEVIDVRLLPSKIRGLSFTQADATHLENLADDSVESISSLHAAEHFGLGRYGDSIDPLGYKKFMHCLNRVLAPAGRLYFSVPIGHERLCFNAHRVFSVQGVLQIFEGLSLHSFSYVDDNGDFYEDVSPDAVPEELLYGCGLFEFTKL